MPGGQLAVMLGVRALGRSLGCQEQIGTVVRVFFAACGRAPRADEVLRAL